MKKSVTLMLSSLFCANTLFATLPEHGFLDEHPEMMPQYIQTQQKIQAEQKTQDDIKPAADEQQYADFILPLTYNKEKDNVDFTTRLHISNPYGTKKTITITTPNETCGTAINI